MVHGLLLSNKNINSQMVIENLFKKRRNSENEKYTDEELVTGVCNKDPHMQTELYISCEKYYFRHYPGVFIVQEADADDIFQNTIIALMQNIERKKIYVEDGVIIGNNKQKLDGTLHTYLMGIAKFKYLEWTRGMNKEPNWTDLTTGTGEKPKEIAQLVTEDWLSDDPISAKKEIIADCLSKMSERCYQIITKFYDEEKDLDIILHEIDSFNSKDALKTAKNKCMNKLKESAIAIYDIRKNIH